MPKWTVLCKKVFQSFKENMPPAVLVPTGTDSLTQNPKVVRKVPSGPAVQWAVANFPLCSPGKALTVNLMKTGTQEVNLGRTISEVSSDVEERCCS
jgi:hypothetical protein